MSCPENQAGLKNVQSDCVVRLRRLSTKPDSLHLNQEDSVRDLVRATLIGTVHHEDTPDPRWSLPPNIESSSQREAGAKLSKLRTEMP